MDVPFPHIPPSMAVALSFVSKHAWEVGRARDLSFLASFTHSSGARSSPRALRTLSPSTSPFKVLVFRAARFWMAEPACASRAQHRPSFLVGLCDGHCASWLCCCLPLRPQLVPVLRRYQRATGGPALVGLIVTEEDEREEADVRGAQQAG